MKHWAYNLATGEILGCNRACDLKHNLKRIACFDFDFFGCRGQWVFCHNGEQAMHAKVREIQEFHN